MPAVGRSLIREAFQDSAYRCFNMKKVQHFKKKKKRRGGGKSERAVRELMTYGNENKAVVPEPRGRLRS